MLLDGYYGVARTYLANWELGSASKDESHSTTARMACAAMRRYARTFPVGWPIALLCAGNERWIAGKPFRAAKIWKRALRAAEQRGTLYVQALIRLEIGRHAPPDDSRREPQLRAACDIFATIEAKEDLMVARACLKIT